MRYTKKFIEARFHMAMEALGVPHGEAWTDRKANVGTYMLDHYYGWQITKMHNEGGAESTPFGSSRYTAREFVAQLDGIINAAHILKNR